MPKGCIDGLAGNKFQTSKPKHQNIMNYLNAKDTFDELKNFEGKATFKGEDTVIDLFVLLPKADMADFNIAPFIAQHQATGSFEVEGGHDEPYTIIGINIKEEKYSDDAGYFMSLIVW